MTDKIVAIPHSGGALSKQSKNLTRYGTPKATIEDIASIVANMVLTYPGRNMTQVEAKALVKIWAEDLAEYPAETINEAFRRYRRSPENKFFPHPGAIIALCEKIPDPEWRRIQDLERENLKRIGFTGGNGGATAKDEPYDER